MGLENYVETISAQLSDGILLLKVMDKVQSGLINWKRVNMDPAGIYKKIENCNYVIELGKKLDFSLVSVAGKDFVDGNLKLALGNLSTFTFD